MEATAQNILVVYELEPQRKHATIFERFDELAIGETLTIHNDHDPKPLYYHLQSSRGDIFDWEYLEQGPDLWRINITKTHNPLEILNVTLIEPRLKHPTIFNKFDSLKPGEAFILLNDHDPRPLYYQLAQMWGDIFTWEYIEQGPFEFRILITKKPLQTETHQVQKNAFAKDENILDVTTLEPRQKHPTIFQRFDALTDGQSLTIHNDHDPKPLYYQMLGERGNIFTWEYLEEGPQLWRIKITKKTTGEAEETLGELAAKDLRKAQVFKKYGLDFCCGGKKTVKEACAEKGIDVTLVEKDLQQADNAPATAAARPLPFNEWNLDFLADYIVNTHHSYVKKVMPDLKAYSDKVARVHSGHHPELLEINRLVQETMKEMAEHTIEEETVLFPYIKKLVALNGNATAKDIDHVQESIDLRIQEHELVGGNMEKIRELSSNYTVPEDGCASYSFLFKSLNEFEEDLHIHVHLENNILFPKAIELEKEISLKNQS